MKKICIAIAALGALVALWVVVQSARCKHEEHQAMHSQPRKHWKDAAIATVAGLAKDSRWLTNQVAAIKTAPPVAPSHDVPDVPDVPEWVSPNLILTSSGEWIVYTNICNKEDERIRDLFIGHGSDGKWYYSDFHFCTKMLTLGVWPFPKPSNIRQFAEWCSLREFDGRSDECLEASWDRKVPQVIRQQGNTR